MKWTPEELQTLTTLMGRPLREQMAALPGRSKDSIIDKRRILRMTPEQKAKMRAMQTARAKTYYGKHFTKVEYFLPSTGATASSDMLRERDKRVAIPPRDLTAALCGDPLPGFSALDRRGA